MGKHGIVSFIKKRWVSWGWHGLFSWFGVLLLMLCLLNLTGSDSEAAGMFLHPLLFADGLFLFLDGGHKFKTRGECASFWIFLGLIIVFSVSSCLSFFWLSTAASSALFDLLSVGLSRGFSAIGLIGGFLLAYSLRRDGIVSGKALLACVMLILSFRALANLIATFADYGVFHVRLLDGYVYYREGIAYSASTEMAVLDGFAVRYVSVRFGTSPFFILASVLPALLFIDARRDKAFFSLLAVTSGVGVLALVLVGYFEAFIVLVPLYLVALTYRFAKLSQKSSFVALSVTIGVISIAVLLVLAVAASGHNIYQSNGVLRKLFDNGRLMRGINQTIDALFSGGWTRILFGMPAYNYQSFGKVGTYATYSSSLWNDGTTPVYWPDFNLHSVEFAALMEGGLPAFLFVAVFFILLVFAMRRFLYQDALFSGYRWPFILLALGILLYGSFFMDLFPYVGVSGYVSPFVYNSSAVLLLAFAGYIYTPVTWPVRRLSRRNEP